MPIIRSAKKQLKQSIKKRLRNNQNRRKLKDILKEVGILVKQGKKSEAAAALPKAYKIIDTAAKKHLIHNNNANRKKSGLAKMVAGVGAGK